MSDKQMSNETMRTDTPTIIKAMRILARDIQSDDGVAALVCAEAADRLEEQSQTITHLTADYEAVKSRLELLEAKLPVYADTGRAFVPGVDPYWCRLDDLDGDCGAEAVYLNGVWMSTAGPCEFVDSTAAACEEAEGKAARETEGGE